MHSNYEKLIARFRTDDSIEDSLQRQFLNLRVFGSDDPPSSAKLLLYDYETRKFYYEDWSLALATSDLPVYRPEDYGAVGDGATDDSAAFNAMTTAIRNSGSATYGAKIMLSPKDYRLDSSWIIGDCGDQLIIEGNGAVLSTATNGVDSTPGGHHAVISWDPNDTYAANSRTVDEEADVYATNRLYMRNIRVNGSGTTNTIGLKLWATYGSVIHNCYFDRTTTGVFTGWALMTIFNACFNQLNADYGFRHESAGANSLWAGATIAFNAGNGTVYNDCRGYNATGATQFLVDTCSNLQFNNCIVEGNAVEYGIHYIDNGTNDREMLIHRLHGENYASGALVKVEGSNDMRLHMSGCRIHQPNLCIFDGVDSTTVEVYMDKQSYFGSGQYLLCDASNRITYRDCRGADFLQNSFYDMVNGEKPQIHLLSSDHVVPVSNFVKYNPVVGPWHHKFAYNEDQVDSSQYDAQYRPLPILTGTPDSNIRQIAFTPGTGHVEFDYTIPTSETALTISLWASIGASLSQVGGDYDPYSQLVTIAHTDANHEITIWRSRTSIEIMLGSGWGTTNQIYTLDAGTYGLQMGYHHFAFVLNGTADPVCYFNNVAATFTGRAGTRATNNRTTLGCSYHDTDHAMNNNYGDTPAKLSLYLTAKDSAAVSTLYTGGYAYDDTADTDSADLVLSASHNFNNTALSTSFADASTSSADGTFVNFAPPYTPTLHTASSTYELLNHYHEKVWHMDIDAATNIRMPWMIPGVPYEIYLVNDGSNSVTFTQSNIHNYMSSTGNYTYPAAATTWTPSSFGADAGDTIKVTLTLINGIVYPLEEVLVA